MGWEKSRQSPEGRDWWKGTRWDACCVRKGLGATRASGRGRAGEVARPLHMQTPVWELTERGLQRRKTEGGEAII